MASEKKSSDAFEAAIKRELQNASRIEAHDCPAPDVLAAYYDRSLSRNERAGVDAHLLSCARCQSMMAAIARADDSPPTLPARETMRGFLQVARVAAPIALIGAGIAFMVGTRTRAQHAVQVAALASPAAQLQPQFAQRAVAPAPPEVPAEKSAPSAPQAFPAPAAGNLIAHHEQLAAREHARAARKKIAPQQLAEAEAPRGAESFNAATPAPAAPSAQAPAVANAPAIIVGNGTAMTSSGMSESTGATSASPMLNRVASPDGGVIWQFGVGGVITRSDNGGSWVTLHGGVTGDLLAASAPSPDVCWMVGKSATVLRTLDRGAHWQIVKPPSREDFTIVTATDSNNATVIASNGNRYVTRDGGVTWSSP